MYNKLTTNGYQKYKEQMVLQASPQELILMVYDCCIKNVKLAQLHIDSQEFEQTNKTLQKAEDCINELVMGLDFNYEIAHNLMSIYDFLLEQMVQANLKKDSSLLPPVLEILTELREAWGQAAKTNRMAQFAGGEA